MEQKRLPIFAERFAKLRGEMTQGEFAEFLGISRPTVGFYENGTRLPDALVLHQIAEKCDVSTDWLIGLSNVKAMNGELRQVCDYTGLSETSVVLLSSSKYKGSPFNVWAGLIDDILKPSCIYRYSRSAWRSAVAEIQAKRSEVSRDQFKIEERRALDDKIAEAVFDNNADSLITQISVYDAARYYRNFAISSVESAAASALHKYVELMKKSALEDSSEHDEDA